MPIAVQGICDLEVRIGKEKISLGSVVIADIDFNVLSWLADCSRCQEFVCSQGQDAFSDPDG